MLNPTGDASYSAWSVHDVNVFQSIKKNMKKYTDQFEMTDRLRQSNVSLVSNVEEYMKNVLWK